MRHAPARNIAIVRARGPSGRFPARRRQARTPCSLPCARLPRDLGFAGQELYRDNRLTIDSLSDRERGILFGAVGLLVLMVAGASPMLATGGSGGDLGALLASPWSRSSRLGHAHTY